MSGRTYRMVLMVLRGLRPLRPSNVLFSGRRTEPLMSSCIFFISALNSEALADFYSDKLFS